MTLHPTLQSAKAKGERALAYLITANPTTDQVRAAMDLFKSAAILAKAHLTFLKETEDQLPPPGAPLFDDGGAPDPDADLTSLAPSPGPITAAFAVRPPLTDEEIEAFTALKWDARQEVKDDLLFEIRTFLNTTQRSEEWPRIRQIWEDLTGERETFIWFSNELRRGGDFLWPHQCKDCGDNISEPGVHSSSVRMSGDLVCNQCKWKRDRAEKERKAKEKAEKGPKKPRAAKPPRSPLVVEEPYPEAPEGQEGGEE